MGDENESFFPTDLVGEMLTFISNTTAYLVERIVPDENLQGIRTSILSHEADPNFMGTFVIMCDGGEGNICNQTVYVIGGRLYSRPSHIRRQWDRPYFVYAKNSDMKKYLL